MSIYLLPGLGDAGDKIFGTKYISLKIYFFLNCQEIKLLRNFFFATTIQLLELSASKEFINEMLSLFSK